MRVLLPTDFSVNAKYAIDYALKLFEEETVEFYLWHVVKASTYVTDDLLTADATFSVYEAITKKDSEALEGLMEDLTAEFNNQKHTFHPIMDYDNFIDSANQIIERESIDLVVMGTKGMDNVEKAIFGSNTLRIIQRTSCPVLVIPDKYVFKPIKKIAFTSAYNSHYIEGEFDVFNRIAIMEDAQIDVIHYMENTDLTESEKANQAILEGYIKNSKHNYVNIEGQEYFDTIHNYIELKNYDIISVTSKKHNFFERLFNLHNVEIELQNLNLPLLVLKG